MKNKKIVLGLLIFLAVLILNCSSVFAYTFKSQVDESNYTVPDLDTLAPEYYSLIENGYIIRQESDTVWAIVILSSADSYFYGSSSVINCKPAGHMLYMDITQSNSWSDASYIKTDGSFRNVKYYGADIYTDINKTNFFFQKPEETELVQMMKQVEMKEVMKEIVGILPLILAVMVLYLGLRKGLQVLSKVLHKA